MCPKEYSPTTFTCSQRYSDNSVVFDGERSVWKKYLELSLVQRYEPEIVVRAKPISGRDGFEFVALNKNSNSEKLASLLKEGFSLLDFYQRTPPFPQGLMQDFFLLSWACLLFLINAPRKEPLSSLTIRDDFGCALQSGTDFLRDALLEEWKFTDLPRKNAKDFLDCFVDIIFRSRSNTYGTNPNLFEQDINRLIYLKRLFFEREIVLTTPKLYN